MILSQYLKFLVNGGLMGIAAWALQSGLYRLLGQGGGGYAAAALLAYIPLIILNFAIQRRMIFGADGHFMRFIIANLLIMLLVSALSPLCRWVLERIAGEAAGDRGGFILAALIGATPSFLLSRFFVFRRGPLEVRA